MQKRKSEQKKQKADVIVKLNEAGNFIPEDDQNHGHNSKKEALGPNTKR